MSANRGKALNASKDFNIDSVAALLAQDAQTHFSEFDSIPLEELNEQFVPMLVAVESNADLRLELVKKFVARKGNPNKQYARSDVNDPSNEYPLHYLATLEDGAEAIKILLAAGADQNLTSTFYNENPLTPLERALADAVFDENVWLNILVFIEHATSPIKPAVLAYLLAEVHLVKDEKVRNDLLALEVIQTAAAASQDSNTIAVMKKLPQPVETKTTASPKELKKQFTTAVKDGKYNIKDLETLLEQGVGAHTSLNETRIIWPLEQAIVYADYDLVKLLLKYQDPTEKNGLGQTSLDLVLNSDFTTRKTREDLVKFLFNDTKFFDTIALEELNRQFVPLLVVVESKADLRLALVRKFVARKGDPNKQYVRNEKSHSSNDYPLHYLAILADGAEAIEILLKAGADQSVTIPYKAAGFASPISVTPIDLAFLNATYNEKCWLNILMFLNFTQSPLSRIFLGSVCSNVIGITNEKIRNDLLTKLVQINADFTEPFRPVSSFPKSGDPQEEKNYAAVQYIYRLAQKDCWSSILIFIAMLDSKTTLDDRERLGWVVGPALYDDTPDSQRVASELLALGANPDGSVRVEASDDLAADFVAQFPSVVEVRVTSLFIAARRSNQSLLRELLKAGANPNERERGFQAGRAIVHDGQQHILDVLIKQNAWEVILDVINFTKVGIEADALAAVRKAAEVSQDQKAKAVVAKLQQQEEEKRPQELTLEESEFFHDMTSEMDRGKPKASAAEELQQPPVSLFGDLPLDELNEQFLPMLVAAESNPGLRLELVREFVARKGDPNKQYVRNEKSHPSNDYPLHYLATLADGAEAIKVLLEAGANQNLTSTFRHHTPITAIEQAVYATYDDKKCGLNILAFIKYAKPPIDPVILGKICSQTDRIENEKIRNDLVSALVQTNADLTAPYRSVQGFPTSGNPEEERNFALTELIYSHASRKYWYTSLYFINLLDGKANLDRRALGWVVGRAILAYTPESLIVGKQLLDLGANPDSTVDAKPDHVLAADFVSGFPGVVKVCIPSLFIAVRRKNQLLLRGLLEAGANPNETQCGFMEDHEVVSTTQTIFDVLIKQNSWDLILDVINVTKVAIEPEALEAVQTAAAVSQDPQAKAVLAQLPPPVETKAQVAIENDGAKELELKVIKSQENVRAPAGKNRFAASRPRQRAEDFAKDASTLAPAASDAESEKIETIRLFKRFIADFKKINENYLQDNFLANNKGSAEEQAAEIRKEIKAHPHGRVAIAANLAKKYPGKCDNTNDDFLVELRNEKFKHERLWVWMRFWKWGKHTVVHKGSENKQTFYRASTFETYVNKLTPIEKHKLADEMRTAATDEKNTSRSASAVRKLK
jgi:ankyrin repeat protein